MEERENMSADIPTYNGTPNGEQAVKDVRLLVSRRDWQLNFSFLLVARNIVDNGPLYAEIKFKHWDVNSGLDNPDKTFSMQPDEMQLLMNELWKIGMRPSGELDSIGQLNSLKSHLDDMRKIAFKFLELK